MWATKKEETVGQVGGNRSETWRTLRRRWHSETKVSSHKAGPTCSSVASREGFSAPLSLSL